jgi:hypothetical protein
MSLDDINLDDLDLVPIERKEHRIPVMLTTKALREIDNWRRGQEDLPSRSAAIRRLVARALKATGDEPR